MQYRKMGSLDWQVLALDEQPGSQNTGQQLR